MSSRFLARCSNPGVTRGKGNLYQRDSPADDRGIRGSVQIDTERNPVFLDSTRRVLEIREFGGFGQAVRL